MKLVFCTLQEFIVNPLLVTFMILKHHITFVLLLHSFDYVLEVISFREQVWHFTIVQNIVDVLEECLIDELSV
jgi:hypothetical protein